MAPQYGVTACSLLRARTGKWVVLYAPRWAYGDSIPGNDPLWASSYGANPAVPYRQAYPGDSSSGWAPYSGRTPTILKYGSRLTIGTQPSSFNTVNGKLDALDSAVHAIGAPTQDQVNTAVLNAMLDPRIQQGIGDAIASHLHVS